MVAAWCVVAMGSGIMWRGEEPTVESGGGSHPSLRRRPTPPAASFVVLVVGRAILPYGVRASAHLSSEVIRSFMELRRLRFELTTEEGVLPAIVAPHPACPAPDGERIERERRKGVRMTYGPHNFFYSD